MSIWNLWEGDTFPSHKTDPTIYYAIGNIDIEDSEALEILAQTMRADGVAPSLYEARNLLDYAVVTHGQVVELDEEIIPSFDNDPDLFAVDATWVEIDEYEG